jgi:hypothetical protein
MPAGCLKFSFNFFEFPEGLETFLKALEIFLKSLETFLKTLEIFLKGLETFPGCLETPLFEPAVHFRMRKMFLNELKINRL